MPLISHNFGIGFVPESMAAAAIERGEVFRVPLDFEMPARHICMVTDPRHPQTNASRELNRMISESMAERQ